MMTQRRHSRSAGIRRRHTAQPKNRSQQLKRALVAISTILSTAVAGTLTVIFTDIARPLTQHNQQRDPAGPLVKLASLEVPFDASRIYAFPGPVDFNQGELENIRQLWRKENNEYHEWMRVRGGARDRISIKVVLEGNRRTPVRIMDMRANAKCGNPFTGTIVDAPAQGGIDDTVRIGFDLAGPDLAGRVYKGEGFGAKYFDSKTVSLNLKQQQVFQMEAVAPKRRACAFKIEMKVLGESRMVVQAIDNNGRPFMVSPLYTVDRYQRAYVGGVISPKKPVSCDAGTTVCGWFVKVNPKTYSGGQ